MTPQRAVPCVVPCTIKCYKHHRQSQISVLMNGMKIRLILCTPVLFNKDVMLYLAIKLSYQPSILFGQTCQSSQEFCGFQTQTHLILYVYSNVKAVVLKQLISVVWLDWQQKVVSEEQNVYLRDMGTWDTSSRHQRGDAKATRFKKCAGAAEMTNTGLA